jgi:hypothetical protein
MRYVPLFIAIQLVSLVLVILGVPICAVLALAAVETTQERRGPQRADMPPVIWGWPSAFWLWSNDEDGVWGPYPHSRWYAFYWTALRNPCNNLRYVPGISKVGRPLWRWTWRLAGRPQYFQMGWNGSGFPVLSGGYDIHASAA